MLNVRLVQQTSKRVNSASPGSEDDTSADRATTWSPVPRANVTKPSLLDERKNNGGIAWVSLLRRFAFVRNIGLRFSTGTKDRRLRQPRSSGHGVVTSLYLVRALIRSRNIYFVHRVSSTSIWGKGGGVSMLWGAARLGLQSMSSVVLRGRQPQRCTDGSIDLLLISYFPFFLVRRR